MDFADFALGALQVLSPVLLAGLTWLAARVAALIRVRIANEHLRGLLLRFQDAVLVATKDLQQTMVDEIKADSADGKISAAERQRIKAAAVANVKSHLGPKGVAELARILGLADGALDSLIGAKVEAAVHDLRIVAGGVNGANGAGRTSPSAPAS